MAIAERLIREHKVAVIPGPAFGMSDGCYFRVAYGALQKATVAEGIGRLVDRPARDPPLSVRFSATGVRGARRSGNGLRLCRVPLVHVHALVGFLHQRQQIVGARWHVGPADAEPDARRQFDRLGRGVEGRLQHAAFRAASSALQVISTRNSSPPQRNT